MQRVKERRDDVQIAVVAVIDYREKIIKHSRSRRVKKFHPIAGDQRDSRETIS